MLWGSGGGGGRGGGKGKRSRGIGVAHFGESNGKGPDWANNIQLFTKCSFICNIFLDVFK